MICSSCDNTSNHVFFIGTLFGTFKDTEIQTILDQCSSIKPIHVKKRPKETKYCHLHFKNHQEASAFYYYYSTGEKSVCRRLGKVITLKAFDSNNNEVSYDTSLIKEEYVNSCVCPPIALTVKSTQSPFINSYKEHKNNLINKISQMKEELIIKRKEVEEMEILISKREEEVNLLNKIINL